MLHAHIILLPCSRLYIFSYFIIPLFFIPFLRFFSTLSINLFRDIVVGTVTTPRDKRWKFDFVTGSGPHPDFCSRCSGDYSSGVNRLERDANHSLHLLPKLRIKAAMPPLPTCFHNVDRNNFTFTLSVNYLQDLAVHGTVESLLREILVTRRK